MRVSQGLASMRKAAPEHKEMKFTALLHHLTVDLLQESFYCSQKQSRTRRGRDHMAGHQLGVEDRLADLHGRVHRGAYRAQPSREFPFSPA